MLAKQGGDVVLVGEWPRRARIAASAIDGLYVALEGSEITITAKNAVATYSTSGPGEDDDIHRCSCLTAAYIAAEQQDPEVEPEPEEEPEDEPETIVEPDQPVAPAASENERRLMALRLAAL